MNILSIYFTFCIFLTLLATPPPVLLHLIFSLFYLFPLFTHFDFVFTYHLSSTFTLSHSHSSSHTFFYFFLLLLFIFLIFFYSSHPTCTPSFTVLVLACTIFWYFQYCFHFFPCQPLYFSLHFTFYHPCFTFTYSLSPLALSAFIFFLFLLFSFTLLLPIFYFYFICLFSLSHLITLHHSTLLSPI